jgi:miniconductance mechanosensitive channel
MPAMPASLVTAINTICGILFFIFMSVFFNEMLDIVNSSYLRKTKRKNHSIKGYIQIGKILVHILAAIMIHRRDVEQSPIIIISVWGRWRRC